MSRRVLGCALVLAAALSAGCTAGQAGQAREDGAGPAAELAAARATAKLPGCPVPVATAGTASDQPGGPDRLPELTLPCLAGGPDIALHRLAGVPMVLNAWASWCVPCRAELPVFQRLADRTSGRLQVLGVDSEEPSMLAALDFAAARGVRFASVYDEPGRLRSVRAIPGLPFTLFVTAAGRVASVHIGPITDRALADGVRRHLGVRVDG
ncbi:MAG TPA: TlpA disulfide reductase family protein [Mycobacteriales bacterium]|nr:TlpA disulfide reductase family protein [Mycobacteriales bacterium]